MFDFSKILSFGGLNSVGFSALLTSRGQSLAESLFVLPFVFGVFSLLILGSHHFGSYYLSDHWVYQSAFCLAEEKDVAFCKNELKKRLNLIPFFHFSIIEFFKNKTQVRVRLKAGTPLLSDREIFEELRVPIRINDFKGAYEK